MSNEELAVLARQGDREAAGELWEQCKRLLAQLARRFYKRYGTDAYARHGVTLKDLEQETFFALLDAVRAFQPEKGWQFTTYLAKASEGRFKAAMGLRKCNPLDIADSLNTPAWDNDSSMETGDLLPDPKAAGELEAVADRAEWQHFHAVLEKELSKLEPVQGAILRCRYYGKQTRRQAAETLRITPAMVRREESRELRP